MEDGSSDNLAEPLRACQVDVRGGSAARNSIAAARERFMALLDSDDVWLPKKLARQVAAVMMITADGGGCNAAADIACVYGRSRFRSSEARR